MVHIANYRNTAFIAKLLRGSKANAIRATSDDANFIL
jgi:ribosomal 50S subunit-associated protein YjgA (DUF615 family)